MTFRNTLEKISELRGKLNLDFCHSISQSFGDPLKFIIDTFTLVYTLWYIQIKIIAHFFPYKNYLTYPYRHHLYVKNVPN